MDQDTSPSGISSSDRAAQQKRSRVLLSCGPCRNSKLKCDRDQPCGQCLKKGRADLCVYAPKPEKHKPARGMAARLKRLEGMVRGMMDADGNIIPGDGDVNGKAKPQAKEAAESPQVMAQVVRGENATTYVGATHCMAMLEDIEDLKSYFDEPEEEEDMSPEADMDGPELLLFARGAPRNREELVAQLPERSVVDRLVTRYFASMSPSQHINHRPTFTRTYARFWQDPNSVPLHWIAQLFMMLALGVFFNNFSAPHEVEGDSPLPPIDRIKHYRSCAGWALVWGKYTQPTAATLPAFLLYVESHFLFNRSAQMTCYVLSGVCVRLMLKMGLHRDPSKLANITPFEGEMRRRMWSMGIQIDLLVAFHMGLPSMSQGIETDTTLPRNLIDDDFDEDTTELRPGRPEDDHTSMTYPIHKSRILRIFSRIAQQAHALAPPKYSDVMQLDSELHETWKTVPSLIKPKPLDECVGVAPSLLIQRFGLASLYHKSICVLHRRYIAEAVQKPEHDYSRKQCLKAAVTLLDYQHTIWQAIKPGHVLTQHGWFVTSLAIHDFILAAMVIYLIIQNEHSDSSDWSMPQSTTPSTAELTQLLKRAQLIWQELSNDQAEFKKTADMLAIMLSKIGSPVEGSPANPPTAMTAQTNGSSNDSSMGSSVAPKSSIGTMDSEAEAFSSLGLGPFTFGPGAEATAGIGFPGIKSTADAMPSNLDFDPQWMQSGDNMDWRYLDTHLANPYSADNQPGIAPSFMERMPLNDIDMMTSGLWNLPS